jgi:hypothetical protein
MKGKKELRDIVVNFAWDKGNNNTDNPDYLLRRRRDKALGLIVEVAEATQPTNPQPILTLMLHEA